MKKIPLYSSGMISQINIKNYLKLKSQFNINVKSYYKCTFAFSHFADINK